MTWPGLLFDTLTRRAMPETVAGIIVSDPAAAAEFTPAELAMLRMAAGARGPLSLSSMPEDFDRHPGCARVARVALEVHRVDPAEWDGDPCDFADVTALIDDLGGPINWRHGYGWKTGRLTKEQRRAANLLGQFPDWANHRRSYNKAVRVLRNLWDHAVAMDAAQRFRRLILISRSGFACDLTRSRLCGDHAAAAFIAYITARKNLRREFTLEGKDNPFDEVAAMLYARCENDPGTDWAMIAGVWPRPEVLARLADEDLGVLLGRWWTVMRDCSVELAGLWAQMSAAQAAWAQTRRWTVPSQIDRSKMIVRAGMDSDRWNNTAGAFNAARAAWIGCATASGSGAMLAPFLPGKVMRVMAADLAYWHEQSGGDVHPDTQVWAALPLPWDVIAGLADCTMADVELACHAVRDPRTGRTLNPVTAGWTAPLLPGQAAKFRPTPDLVHGVTVADPAWAGLLRRAGVFSGKTARADRALEAAMLRAEADRQGMITGELPAYDQAGMYKGTTHNPAPLLKRRPAPEGQSGDRAAYQLNRGTPPGAPAARRGCR
jgi:hypothetical protein